MSSQGVEQITEVKFEAFEKQIH